MIVIPLRQMPQPFFTRLKQYYESVASVLRGEANAASIFPNTTDKGGAREQLYLDFLQKHLPSACNVNLGGFVFSQTGDESRQIDVIVTTDVCPQFNVSGPDAGGKSFACVDGVLAIASIKSQLHSAAMRDVVQNIASIPQHNVDYPWDQIAIENPMIDMWPLKIVYAIDGIAPQTLMETFAEFNDPEHTIPPNRLPDIIHVAGKYCIRRAWQDLQHDGRTIPAGRYFTTTVDVDVASLSLVVERIQQLCLASRHIPYNYSEYNYRMFGVQP